MRMYSSYTDDVDSILFFELLIKYLIFLYMYQLVEST